MNVTSIRLKEPLEFGQPLSYDADSQTGFDWRGGKIEQGALVYLPQRNVEGRVMELRARGSDSFEARVQPLQSLAGSPGAPIWQHSKQLILLHQAAETEAILDARSIDVSDDPVIIARRCKLPYVDGATAHDWRGHPIVIGQPIVYRSNNAWRVATVAGIEPSSSESTNRPFALIISRLAGGKARALKAVETVTCLPLLPAGLSEAAGERLATVTNWHPPTIRELDSRGLPLKVDDSLLCVSSCWSDVLIEGRYKGFIRGDSYYPVTLQIETVFSRQPMKESFTIYPVNGVYLLPGVPENSPTTGASALEDILSDLALAD